MNIVIGNDHAAVDLKKRIVAYLEKQGHTVTNMGVDSDEAVDYPDTARIACDEYLKGEYDFGIVCCGTGIGVSISANKIKGIRCALLCNTFSAQKAKTHNKANFIAFAGRIVYSDKVEDMLDAYINGTYKGGRHQRRIEKISELESR